MYSDPVRSAQVTTDDTCNFVEITSSYPTGVLVRHGCSCGRVIKYCNRMMTLAIRDRTRLYEIAFENNGPKGSWINYIVTWDRLSIKTFVNGRPFKKANVIQGPIHLSHQSHIERIAIGRCFSDLTVPMRARMALDDFKVWERAFDATEVLQVYHFGE